MASATVDAHRPDPTPTRLRLLCLLGGLYVVSGDRRIPVPEGSQRLLAFVAVHGGHVDRRRAAATLWPQASGERGAGNLRSALWRLRAAGIDVVWADKFVLWLAEGTTTDVENLCGWAGRVCDGSASARDLEDTAWLTVDGELLPGWYDDWVVVERERVRRRLLHALESLSRTHLAAGRIGAAIVTAIAAVALDPLRESAQTALIEAHLVEGNVVEARRAYATYRRWLRCELGLEPGPFISALVRPGATVTGWWSPGGPHGPPRVPRPRR